MYHNMTHSRRSLVIVRLPPILSLYLEYGFMYETAVWYHFPAESCTGICRAKG
jgi:hypothetical protein